MDWVSIIGWPAVTFVLAWLGREMFRTHRAAKNRHTRLNVCADTVIDNMAEQQYLTLWRKLSKDLLTEADRERIHDQVICILESEYSESAARLQISGFLEEVKRDNSDSDPDQPRLN